ncbi:MAG TPA: hypothetical protein VKU42_14580 [Candidatus Angelobacter sp.]|nr:hypothetical protein [Candidatus Angelobacter sp.]
MNVYGVKYVCISERGEKPNVQRITSKEGTLHVLADCSVDAGNIAMAHLKVGDVVEVNVHLVHEVAKNVITDASQLVQHKDVATLLDQSPSITEREGDAA